MIASHDTYTFLPAKNQFFELFSYLWRTQNKNIKEQKECGVKYFDIRVCLDNGKYRVCHGLVNFNLVFDSLGDILDQFSTYKVRIILEKGNDWEESVFKFDVECYRENPTLSFAGIKKNWKVLLNRDPELIDLSYSPFRNKKNFFKDLFTNMIKKLSKKYKITDEMEKSDTVYFKDFV